MVNHMFYGNERGWIGSRRTKRTLIIYIIFPHFSLEVYGANITTLRAEVGSRPTNEALKHALGEKKYKMVTVTHVDTS